MGQKVNPISFRLQVHKNWSSRWFAGKRDFAKWLAEDIRIRELVEAKFASRPTINRIEIERSANLITVTIHTAKAGVVIGRGGAGITELKKDIEKIASLPVRINVEEVKRPELAAKLVAENIARQLERRANFRRATKMAAQNTMNAGAKGIRIEVAGRLNNAEMARREKIIEGSVPLHTLRAPPGDSAGNFWIQRANEKMPGTPECKGDRGVSRGAANSHNPWHSARRDQGCPFR